MQPNHSIPGTATNKIATINSTGVNSAWLEGDDSCVSLMHGVCALIVVTNGTQTFVTHQLRPYPEQLIPELYRVRKILGLDAQVKFYHADIGNPDAEKLSKQNLLEYRSVLEKTFPLQQIEKHRGPLGSYHVTAKGEVTSLGMLDAPEYLDTVRKYGQDFWQAHQQQPISTNSPYGTEDLTSVFNYSSVPAWVSALAETHQEKLRLNPKDKLGAYAEIWNKVAAQAALHSQGEEPRTDISGLRHRERTVKETPSTQRSEPNV